MKRIFRTLGPLLFVAILLVSCQEAIEEDYNLPQETLTTRTTDTDDGDRWEPPAHWSGGIIGPAYQILPYTWYTDPAPICNVEHATIDEPWKYRWYYKVPGGDWQFLTEEYPPSLTGCYDPYPPMPAHTVWYMRCAVHKGSYSICSNVVVVTDDPTIIPLKWTLPKDLD